MAGLLSDDSNPIDHATNGPRKQVLHFLNCPAPFQKAVIIFLQRGCQALPYGSRPQFGPTSGLPSN